MVQNEFNENFGGCIIKNTLSMRAQPVKFRQKDSRSLTRHLPSVTNSPYLLEIVSLLLGVEKARSVSLHSEAIDDVITNMFLFETRVLFHQRTIRYVCTSANPF